MENEQIRATLNSGSGRALRKYLIRKMYELRDIQSVKDISNATEQAIELKAQKKAYNKLDEIFREIMDMGEEPREKDQADSFEVGID